MEDLEKRITTLEEETAAEKAKGKDRNKRYAFEWYVKSQDRFYHKMATKHTNNEVSRIEKTLKKITALAVTSTAISLIALALVAAILSKGV